MKLYILRWNPAFSMKYSNFNYLLECLRNAPIDDFNWSIYDHEDLESGDMFILAQVGTGRRDGIVGFGLFNSEPYAEQNWREKDETNRFYADMSIHCLISHEEYKNWNTAKPQNYTMLDEHVEDDSFDDSFDEILPFCADALEKNFPNVDWHRGHAGVLIPEDTVEPLILYLMKQTLPLRFNSERISFTDKNNANPLREFFAHYINGLCPNFKQKIIENNKLRYQNYNAGESVDKSLIEISEKKFNKARLTKDSPEEDFVKFFVPIA